MKRRRGIRSVSAKRLAESEERTAVIAATHARAGGRCEGAGYLPGPCSPHGVGPDGRAWGLDCNELRPRGRGGDHLDLANTVSLCRAHHRYVTDHRGSEMHPWVQKALPPGAPPDEPRRHLELLPGWPS